MEITKSLLKTDLQGIPRLQSGEDVSNLYEIYLNQIMSKEYETEEAKEEQIQKIITYCNQTANWMQLLSEKIDIDKYITLKDVNELVSHSGLYYNATMTKLLEKISNNKITPYTIEVFMSNSWRPEYGVLKKLLIKTDNKLTVDGKQNIINRLYRFQGRKYGKPSQLKKMIKLIESCTETVYIPNENERVNIENDFHNGRNRGYNEEDDNDNNTPVDGEIGIINQIERELDKEMRELGSEDDISDVNTVDDNSVDDISADDNSVDDISEDDSIQIIRK